MQIHNECLAQQATKSHLQPCFEASKGLPYQIGHIEAALWLSQIVIVTASAAEACLKYDPISGVLFTVFLFF